MSSRDVGGYTLRSRKHKMVPFVTSSTKPIVSQDTLESGSQLHSQNNEFGTSRIMSDNQDGLLGHVTVLDKSPANGAATFIPLHDPGGNEQEREGWFLSHNENASI